MRCLHCWVGPCDICSGEERTGCAVFTGGLNGQSSGRFASVGGGRVAGRSLSAGLDERWTLRRLLRAWFQQCLSAARGYGAVDHSNLPDPRIGPATFRQRPARWARLPAPTEEPGMLRYPLVLLSPSGRSADSSEDSPEWRQGFRHASHKTPRHTFEPESSFFPKFGE